MERTSKKSILNGIFWTFSGTGIQVFLQFFVFIILSRLLEPEYFGVMATATALITVLSIFSKLGVGPSLVQKEKINIKHIHTGYTISILFSFLLTIFVWFIAPIIASFFNMPELKPVLRTLSLVHILQGFSLVSQALMQRNLEFKKISIIQITSYILYGTTGITLSFAGFGLWALVFSYILNAAVSTVMYILMQEHSKQIYLDYSIAKDLLVFGSGYSLGTIYNQMALRGDTFVLGKFLGATSLGIYSRAYQLFDVPVKLIGTVIEKVLFPSFSRIQSDVDRLREIYKSSITLTAIICIPASLFLALTGSEVILFLFGEKWVVAAVPFKVLILALLPRVSYKISDSLTKSKGKVFKSANRQLVYGLCVVIGVFIGQKYGLLGASIGVLIAIIINYFYMAQIAITLSEITWKEFFYSHVTAIKIAIITMIPTHLVYILFINIININTLTVFVTSMVFLTMYCSMLYFTPKAVFRKDQEIVLGILEKLKIRQTK